MFSSLYLHCQYNKLQACICLCTCIKKHKNCSTTRSKSPDRNGILALLLSSNILLPVKRMICALDPVPADQHIHGTSSGAFAGSWAFPLCQPSQPCATNHETPAVKIMDLVKLSIQP